MGVERTDVLRRYGLPLNPIAEGVYQTLGKAPRQRAGRAQPARPHLCRPLQCRGGVAARDHLLLGADLPARQGGDRRAPLPAGDRLRLLRRLGVRRADLSRQILHGRRLRGGRAEEARRRQGPGTTPISTSGGSATSSPPPTTGRARSATSAWWSTRAAPTRWSASAAPASGRSRRPSSRCGPPTSRPSANSRS